MGISLLINLLSIFLLNHLVYKMSENSQNCQSILPRAQGDIFTLLVQQSKSHRQFRIDSFLS